MRKAGFTYKEIANKADVPWATIRSRCQILGIQPEEKVIHSRNRKPIHDYPRWLIEMMYWDCKLSTVDIAYELDISKNSVLTMMNRLEIPRRTRGEAKLLHMERNPEWKPPYNPEWQRMATQASVKVRQRKARRKAQRRMRKTNEQLYG